MRLHRTAALAATIAVVALGATSCAQSQRGEGGSKGASDTFTFAAAGAPKHFDPFYATDGETFRVTRQMMDGLVSFKPGTAEVAPGLATEYKSSADGKTWTFTLREGVKFHDGTEFNAKAVCDNFERMFNQVGEGQKDANSAYWVDNFGGFKDGKKPSLYKSCTANDPKTAVIQLNSVTSKFPAVLGLPSFAMQSPKAMTEFKANDVKKQGEGFVFPEYATKHPTGTGAFMFDSYDQANKTVTLKRNDSYWGEKPAISKLIYKIIPDESARKQELQAKSIQGYDFPNPQDWKALKESNEVLVRPAFNIMYLGLNANNNPKLKDLRVRQAIMHAINREQLVQTQLPENAKVATQFIPDTVAGYNKSLQAAPHDAAKAKNLLKQAGAEGMTLNFWYPSEVTRPYMPNPQKIHEAIRKDLEAVGIKVTVTTKAWNGGYLEQVDAGKADAFLLGWTGDYNTADNFIGTFFGKTENRFTTKNYPWGDQLAKMLAETDQNPNEAARTAKYEEINAKIMNEFLPAIPISHSPPAMVIAKGITGVTPSPLTDEQFKGVKLG